MPEAQTLTLTLEKPVAGGRSLARHEGRIVLVSGGIPGERVRATLERSAGGVAFARVTAIETASSDRVEPGLDVACGGLTFAHVRYERQLLLKRAIVEDALVRIGKIAPGTDVERVGSPTTEWRMRSRLHVRRGNIGFFREGSHDLCDAARSAQLMPGLLDSAADTLARLRPDVARQVEGLVVTSAIDGTGRAIHLDLARPLPRHGDVWQHQPPPHEIQGVSASLSTSLGRDGIPSRPSATLGRDGSPSRPSATLGRDGSPSRPSAMHRQVVTLAGDPHVREPYQVLGMPGAMDDALVRHAASFFQGNRHLVPALVQHVMAALDLHVPVIDLYAGVGPFGLCAAHAGAGSVTCVEGDPVAAEDLVANSSAFAGRVRAERSDVDAFASQEAASFGDASVIVDPPRTGLRPLVTQALGEHRPRVLVYVSCDPATLARDLRALVHAGFELRRLTMFDLFPLTAHVETVAVLGRQESRT